ncbi:MAG: HAD-IIB family hydrolase [Pseudomonadota bacterium]
MNQKEKRICVFTDMDGTLLDHYTYDHTPALTLLKKLKARSIPVIPVTSKTSMEMEHLCNEIGLVHGYVAENGAVASFASPQGPLLMAEEPIPPSNIVKSFVKPASHWQALVKEACNGFSCGALSSTSAEEFSSMTGLDCPSAVRAMKREFSEIVSWQDSERNLEIFKQRLLDSGANVLKGGRFVHITGDIDKGRAMAWFVKQFGSAFSRKVVTIALGDSENDVAMLARADVAVIVRSPVHDPPAWPESNSSPSQKILLTEQYGPRGWRDGMKLALSYLGIEL